VGLIEPKKERGFSVQQTVKNQAQCLDAPRSEAGFYGDPTEGAH
jgi:hypothetical protein